MKAPVVPDEPPVADVEPVCRPAVKAVVTPANRWKRLAWATAATLAAIAISSSVFWWWSARRSVQAASSSRTLPWSALRQTNRQIHLVFCDPEIVTVQRLLNYSVSLSDYANQRYWPSDMTPDARQIMQAITFRGVSVAAVDANIALKIDHLIAPLQHPLLTHTARGLRLGDFKTEDSFILFGSPRSNPWVELFQDQLDFRFEFDSNRRAEFVRNRRPAQGESQVYTPTAEGWGTGNAYAIIALIGNPDQSGQVLLLAGSNAEATEAAGSLASNAEAMAKVLRAHGIEPGGRSRHFEILLRVSTMAGMPNTFEVMACHALGPAS